MGDINKSLTKGSQRKFEVPKGHDVRSAASSSPYAAVAACPMGSQPHLTQISPHPPLSSLRLRSGGLF